MASTFRHGALYVVEEPRSRDEIQRAIKELDDRLFVEKQITYAQEAVWCVVVAVGGDVPPITVLEYRDEHGDPLPDLSWEIVERMKRMDRDSGRLTSRVITANRDRIERARQDARQAWEEMGADYGKRTSAGYSAVLPRGQHLRRSRDKRRARGEIV